MAEEHLMTVEEFNQAITKWALKVRAQSRSSLKQTRASGKLAINIGQFVDKESSDKPAYKIKFNFFRYGVYRAYGAGRGYVIMNGVPVRGYRVRSDCEIKKRIFGGEAKEMLENGYRPREINVAKKVYKDKRKVRRTPLDWIDRHIRAGVDELADAVQEFYGDEAIRQMLKNFNKLQIKKK